MQHIHVADSEIIYPIMTNMTAHRRFYENILSIVQTNRNPDKETITIGTGTSGASIGTFLGTMDSTIKYVQLLKKNEVTHRSRVEFSYTEGGPSTIRPWELWLVDDFVSSGSTIRNMIQTLKAYRVGGFTGFDTIEGLIAGATFTNIPSLEAKLLKVQIEEGITIKKWYTV